MEQFQQNLSRFKSQSDSRDWKRFGVNDPEDFTGNYELSKTLLLIFLWTSGL